MNESTPTCPNSGQLCAAQLCPLSRVVAGSAVRIKELSTPPDVSHRLREMGFCENQRIKLLSSHTNFVCLVCNARLGISSQLADHILVELLPAQPPVA